MVQQGLRLGKDLFQPDPMRGFALYYFCAFSFSAQKFIHSFGNKQLIPKLCLYVKVPLQHECKPDQNQ
jgi:hypothetical protein